jgi:hypothetical protein
MATQDSLEMDAQTYKASNNNITTTTDMMGGGYLSGSHSSTSSNSLMHMRSRNGVVESWFELWDYIGGTRFRGFVAERNGQRGMFAFFDHEAAGHNLKPRCAHLAALYEKCCHTNLLNSLLALIELCSDLEINCSELNLCIDRHIPDAGPLMKSFGWVGFEASTLAEWTDGGDIISERWLFLTLET